MTNNEFIIILNSKHRNDLNNVCRNLYIKYDEYEDNIQDLYIKILGFRQELIDRYSNDNNNINIKIVCQIFINLLHEKYIINKRKIKINYVEEYDEYYDNYYEDNTNEEINLYEIINNYTKYWFDKQILLLYFNNEKMSIRMMAKETKINYNVIQKIIYDFKKYINIKHNS